MNKTTITILVVLGGLISLVLVQPPMKQYYVDHGWVEYMPFDYLEDEDGYILLSSSYKNSVKVMEAEEKARVKKDEKARVKKDENELQFKKDTEDLQFLQLIKHTEKLQSSCDKNFSVYSTLVSLSDSSPSMTKFRNKVLWCTRAGY